MKSELSLEFFLDMGDLAPFGMFCCILTFELRLNSLASGTLSLVKISLRVIDTFLMAVFSKDVSCTGHFVCLDNRPSPLQASSFLGPWAVLPLRLSIADPENSSSSEIA